MTVDRRRGAELRREPQRASASSAPASPGGAAGLDGFYNSRRIQKRLGYLGPVKFEEKHYADQAATERANLNTRQPALTS
ncbi:hypothetical protein [Streptomyces sp. NPDC005181]|uniref:hypothetical protein n=1 Tax=Streptomyces sp. NPDC005181 TaxID=3156869 RepID=UPI0033B891C3